MATITTTTTSTGTSMHHSNLNNHHPSSRKSSSSDEEVVHVVTNVYQIPVMQQHQYSQISNLNDSSTKVTDLSGLSGLGGLNSHRGNGTTTFNLETLIDGEQIQSKASSNTYTVSKVTHKVIDANEQQQPAKINSVPVKEKYQIRSIVEIYENPSTNETIDISKTKRNTTYEETHNYSSHHINKYGDTIDFLYPSKN